MVPYGRGARQHASLSATTPATRILTQGAPSAHRGTLVVRGGILVAERREVPGMADAGAHVAAQNLGSEPGPAIW
jgi:hypothetical protein